MITTSPVSCLSDDFSLYRVFYFRIFCNCYHTPNNIHLMTILTMIGLYPGPLVRAILIFALKIPLVLLTTPLVVLTIMLVVFVV